MIPKAWFDDKSTRQRMLSTVREFLRGTERIVSVVLYTVAVWHLPEHEMILMRHRFLEIDNPKHRFDRSWALFRDYQVPEERVGVPPKWNRILCKGLLTRDK